VTAIIELTTRSGLAAPLQIADIDVAHIESGVGLLVFLAALAALGGWGRLPTGWPRWLAGAGIAFYATVAATGLLALLPFSTLTRDDLVDGHLLAAVATVPITVILAVLLLRGDEPRAALGGRQVLACALVLAPAAIGLIAPRAVAPLAEEGVGSTWTSFGLNTYTDRIAVLPGSPHRLLAGGSGLYLANLNQNTTTPLHPPTWHEVPGFTKTSLVLGLLVSGRDIFVGTVTGAFEATSPTGPYRRLPVHAGGVHAFAVDPGHPQVVWATSYAGPERSTDGGGHFSVEKRGMISPDTSWAMAYLAMPRSQPVLVCSDEDALYVWDATRWIRTSSEPSVVSLDQHGDVLWSSSMGGGVERGVPGGAARLHWQPENGGLTDRRSGPIIGIHVVSVSAVTASKVMYAGTMLDGVAVSLDGGASWSGTWEGLRAHGVVSRVLVIGTTLVAATDAGVYEYHLPSLQGATPLWWALVVALSLAGSLAGCALLLARGRERE
jgi:hypothetical protein